MDAGQAHKLDPVGPDDRAPWRSIWHVMGLPVRWLRLTGPARSPLRRGLLVILIAGGMLWLAWNAYGWHHLLSAKRDLSVGHSKQAASHLAAALKIWPNNPKLHLLAARASWLNEDFEGAEYNLTRCQNDPAIADDAQLERVLVRAAKGEVVAVQGVCDALLKEKHPQTPAILQALAIGNMSLLRLGETAHMLDLWLGLEPDNAQAIYLYAKVHQQTGNNLDALKFFRRAIELDPARSDARLALANLHLDLGQAQEALPQLQEVCRLEPSNFGAKSRLAQALVMLGKTEEGVVLLDEVLAARPNFGGALVEKGKIALRGEHLEEAEQLLRQACQAEPSNRAARYQLLQCLQQRGNVGEARKVQDQLGQIDDNLQRINQIVTEELAQRDLDPDLNAELGELLLKAGAIDDGMRWINRALKMDPHQPRAHRALAAHYESLGQSRLAQQHLAQIDAAEATPEAPRQRED